MTLKNPCKSKKLVDCSKIGKELASLGLYIYKTIYDNYTQRVK